MSNRFSNLVPAWLIALSGCSVAVLGAMGWITHRALTLEVAEAKARAEATRQEAVRLALWRMDSWMTSLIAREAARPYFHYLSFYPADRPYSFYSADPTLDTLGTSEAVSASPLLSAPPQDVKLYFQIWPDGHVTSPQVPSGGLRGLALLADASDNNIDAAAISLNELSLMLQSSQSRQSLAGDAAGGMAFDSSRVDLWADAASPLTRDRGGSGGQRDLPPFVGGSQADPAGVSVATTSPTSQPVQASSPQATSRASTQQQMEGDGKQRWQTANDYDVRQQVADATRNISQSRSNVAPYQSTTRPGNDDAQTGGASLTAADVSKQDEAKANEIRLAEAKLAGAKLAEAKNAAERASTDKAVDPATTGSPIAATSEPKSSKSVDVASPPSTRDQTGAERREYARTTETPDQSKEALKEHTKDKVAPGKSPSAPPAIQTGGNTKSAPDEAEAGAKSPRADGAPVESGQSKSPGGAPSNESTTIPAPQRSETLKKEFAAPVSGAPAAIPPAAASPSTAGFAPPVVPGAPGGVSAPSEKATRLRSAPADGASFPVVVRSIAVDPTPLVTACLASPLDFMPTSAASHASVPFNLFLTRQVPLESGRVTQGMWLNWPVLRTSLLDLSKDLVPGATLELCAPLPPNAAASDTGLMLASIPARLILPSEPVVQFSMLSLLTGETWSPTRIAIVGGWIAVLTGILAIGWVLRQSVQLGERRGRFVSAVTHELRTPLTTFALYSQMLADGMVQDPDAQREYHQTLRKESDRLSRIVESVLDYARLGKRRSDTNGQVIRPAVGAADLLAAVEPHLRSRASVAGLDLVVDAPDLGGITLRAERDSIERILENLVENAGKYAADHGDDHRLHLIARLEGRWLHLDIADHGPGIPSGESRRVFAPFERGRAQQDGSKPGLGLGLAFARGLARDLGGELILLAPQAGYGAVFRLRIPAEIQPENTPAGTESAQDAASRPPSVENRPE